MIYSLTSFLDRWISDTRSQGYISLQSLVKRLGRTDIASDTVLYNYCLTSLLCIIPTYMSHSHDSFRHRGSLRSLMLLQISNLSWIEICLLILLTMHRMNHLQCGSACTYRISVLSSTCIALVAGSQDCQPVLDSRQQALQMLSAAFEVSISTHEQFYSCDQQ
jgi:hypothetical protein